MKKIFVILGILFFGYYLLDAQEIKPDLRLEKVFAKEYLDDIMNNHVGELEFLNWSLDNSYRIIDIPEEKRELVEKLRYFNSNTKEIGDVVTEYVETDFCIFDYYFERKADKDVIYSFGDTSIGIVILSQENVAHEFNKNRR